MVARLVGFWLVALALLGAPAQAQNKPDYEAARKLYLGAKESMNKGEYAAAIRQYILAYDITKDPSLFKQIGNAYEASGRKKEAAVYYRRYLAEAKPGPDTEEVRAHVAALEGTAPAVPPTTSAPPTSTAPPPKAPPPVSQPTTEPPKLPPPEPQPPPAAITPPAAAAPPPPPAPAMYQERGGSWQRGAAWVSVGLTAVFLTTGSVLATSSASREDDIQRLIDFRDPATGQPKQYSGSTKEDYDSKKDEGERLNRFSTYAFIGAGACAGAAILFFVLDATRGVETTHARVAPVVGPGSVGIVAGWEL